MRGPQPTYQPTFGPEFLAVAQQIVRQRKVPAGQRQRAALVCLLHGEPGLSHAQAAAFVGMHTVSVRRWRRRWASGDFSLEDRSGRGRKAAFSPLERAQVQAIACEVIFETERPLSRQSLADLTTRARTALRRPISRATVWRILHTADLKPWRFEYWIFPRDPKFVAKAEVILDLYAGFWQGTPLTPKDCIVSSDEKTSIQARIRRHRGLPPAPGRQRRVEFEYKRGGALQYLAGWDVRRGCVTGRCEPHTGIEPFGRLVAQVMAQEPYCSAKRVFWVVDNGSSHRGAASIKRLRKAHPNAIMVHTPIHASWLNQVEIYFAQIQRKVLTPNDFTSLAEVESRLHLYEELTNRQPRPFQWKFDRAKLTAWWQRLEAKKNNAQKPDQYL